MPFDPAFPLQTTPVARVGHWRLLAPLAYIDDELGRITIPAGYETDYLTGWRDSNSQMDEASVVHDWLCTMARMAVCTRAQADAVFYRALRDLGISGWRAWGLWIGVRTYAVVHGL